LSAFSAFSMGVMNSAARSESPVVEGQRQFGAREGAASRR
jgi:hypothetical protein